MLLQILPHSLVHNVSEGHIFVYGKVFHPGMNTLVYHKIAMHRRLFLATGAACGFSLTVLLVEDNNPSSPLFISPVKSFFAIAVYFSFNTSCANDI